MHTPSCTHVLTSAAHTPHESSAFYANEVQLDLGRIALVLSIYAGMHVLLNPVVGWLIDRYSCGTAARVWVSHKTRHGTDSHRCVIRSHRTKVNRFGRKKPFVLLAAVAQAVCFAQLVNAPAASATSSYKFAWYLGWSLGRGLASLTLATSYYAWAVQLTLNSGDRTFVFGLQRWFWQLGGLIGAAGPRACGCVAVWPCGRGCVAMAVWLWLCGCGCVAVWLEQAA